MHRRQLNHARLGVVLRPRGPLLVKSGLETPDPTRPGMEFVRTRHADLGATVYLPGSSLKGALRSHTERVFRGLLVKVCDPFDKDEACRKASGESPQVFHRQCPACRTFGSLKVAGRLQILDAYPWSPEADASAQAEATKRANATEQRWQVGIDRKSGQAQTGALFDLEVVVGGEFHTEIHLHNFELWQLAVTAAALRDVDEGHVPVGFGKFRGLGQVAVDVGSLRMSMTGRRKALCGVAALCDEAERRAYGLERDDVLAIPAGDGFQRTWRGTDVSLDGERLQQTLTSLVDGPLAGFVKNRRPAGRAGSGS